MKKSALLLAALTAVATPSFAGDVYLGLATGPSTTNDDCSGLTRCDKSSTAYKAYAGVMLTPQWAVEMGYGRLGQVSANLDALHVAMTHTAFNVGGALWGQFNPTLAGVVRMGAAFGKAKVDGEWPGVGSTTLSDNATNPYFGLGLAYAVAPTASITADLDFNKVEFDGASSNVRGLTLGAKFKF